MGSHSSSSEDASVSVPEVKAESRLEPAVCPVPLHRVALALRRLLERGGGPAWELDAVFEAWPVAWP